MSEKNSTLPVVAYLVEGGETYRDRAFTTRPGADQSVADRSDNAAVSDLVRLSDALARIAELQAQVEELRTEAKVASDRIQELGRFTKAQRGEIEGLRAAVAESLNVLGTGPCEVNTCEGCRYEHAEAVSILSAAIDSARAGREDGNGR